MKHAKKTAKGDKYGKLIQRKKGLYTADNRPIEVYKKGSEKIYVAFNSENHMEIVGHNPLPLLAGILGRKAISSSIGAVASSVLGRKAEQQPKEKTLSPKSLRDNIIEREVYGDKDFSRYD